jgi:hypothetical protein
MIETLGNGGIAHYTFNFLAALTKKNISAYLFTAANHEFLGRSHSYKVYLVMFRITNRLIRFFPYLLDEKPIPTLLRGFTLEANASKVDIQWKLCCTVNNLIKIHL